MAETRVRWPHAIDEVICGDLTAAAAYVTKAGGTVVSAVGPFGIGNREEGLVGFTTSLGFAKKLEHIIRDPRVCLTFHTREHGFSTSPRLVLVQGTGFVDLRTSRDRLEAFVPQAERYLGELKRGLVWDWLLHEYYYERVFVDIKVKRIVAWNNLSGAGEPEVLGSPLPPAPGPQSPPKQGTEPRIEVDKAALRVVRLGHRVLGYRGADGYPVVVPVERAGHDRHGMRLVTPDGLLPPGARRGGLMAYACHPQLVGLSTRTFTGWLEVAADGIAVFAPHTDKSFEAPQQKTLMLIVNGMYAKWGMPRARRAGVVSDLEAASSWSTHATE